MNDDFQFEDEFDPDSEKRKEQTQQELIEIALINERVRFSQMTKTPIPPSYGGMKEDCCIALVDAFEIVIQSGLEKSHVQFIQLSEIVFHQLIQCRLQHRYFEENKKLNEQPVHPEMIDNVEEKGNER